MSDSPRIIRRLSILVSMCISVAFATASEGTLRAQRLSGGTGAIPKFEVVSVKLRRGYDRPAPLSFDWTPSGYIAEGMPLSWLIAAAYGTKIALVIQTPSWAASQRFDIAAKVGPAGIEALSKLTLGEKNSMLKQILDQRFHVRVHTESRLSPVYELSVLKQGSKLVALSKTTDRVSSPPEKKMTLSSNSLSAENMPIADLTSVLWKISGRKVIDKTGLNGLYSYSLRWTPEETYMSGTVSEETYPPISTALKEQLGLQITPSKAPIDFIVVDHADAPSPN